jgi:hypothetical protein
MEITTFNLRPGNIVFDMDEILFNITPYIYKKIRLNWERFFPYLKNLGPLTDEQILSREHFYITDWLLKDKIREREEYARIVWDEIKDLVFNENLYNNVQPTKLCRETLLNPEFLENPAIKSCIILTRSLDSHPGMLYAKQELIEKFFKHPKIKLVVVGTEEKKSDALKTLGIDWSLILDDEIRNIQDYAENFDLERREFLIPEMGYNKIPPHIELLIKEKGGSINYYKNTF